MTRYRAPAMPTGDNPLPDPTGRALWYLIPLGIVVVLFVGGLVTVATLTGAGTASDGAATTGSAKRDLPDYWTVKRDQTYSQIARSTGLTVEQLEDLNPRTDPSALTPGQRLRLRSDIPPPRAKPLGPRYRAVRSGESFGSIAADTGRSIATLRRLNPKLKPAELQPGDRVRLRR